MTFFNTIHVRGKQLTEYEITSGKQEALILEFFEQNPDLEFTPEDLMSYHPYLVRTPITSIRRAFSNLKEDGRIVKTDNQIEGMYGKPIYTWRLKKDDDDRQLRLVI